MIIQNRIAYKNFSKFYNREIPLNYKLIIFLTIILVYLIPIWCFKYIPFQDSPNHLLSVHIQNNIDNQLYDYSDNFRVSFSIFKPYALYFLIMNILTKLFPLLISEKIFLTIYIVFFAVSFFFTEKVISKDNLFISFIVFLFIYNLMMFFGFYQYLLSIPVFFFALAFFIQNKDLKSFKQIIIINILMLLLFFCHITSLVAFLITLVCLDLINNRGLKFIFILGTKILPVLTLIVIVNLSYFFSSDFKPLYGSIIDSIVNISRWFYFDNIANKLIFLIVIILEAILLIKIVINKPSLNKLRFIIVGVVIFTVYLFLPKAIPNFDIWYVNSRLIPFFLLLPFLSVNLKINRFKENLFILLIVLASMFIFINTFIFFKGQNKLINHYISGIPVVHGNPKILPLTAKTDDRINPLGHAWAYYHIEKGGVGPYSFAGITYYPIEYLHKPDSSYLPSPGENSVELIDNNIISYYDYVFLAGKNDKVENIMAKGDFKKVYANNVLTIWRIKDTEDKK
jgi:hypothetical protein